jgi:hypothetical protein
MELTEQVVMNCLFADDAYVRKALPFIVHYTFQYDFSSNQIQFYSIRSESINDL